MPANPMTTKTGKTRLGPLSLAQPNEMLEKSSRTKDRVKSETVLEYLKQD